MNYNSITIWTPDRYLTDINGFEFSPISKNPLEPKISKIDPTDQPCHIGCIFETLDHPDLSSRIFSAKMQMFKSLIVFIVKIFILRS